LAQVLQQVLQLQELQRALVQELVLVQELEQEQGQLRPSELQMVQPG
jgi:hypothetical protein